MNMHNSRTHATDLPSAPSERLPSLLLLRWAGQPERPAQDSSVKGQNMRPQKTIAAVLAAGWQAAVCSSSPAPTSPKTSGPSEALTSPSTKFRKDYGRETQ
jgi:hypothetical protein